MQKPSAASKEKLISNDKIAGFCSVMVAAKAPSSFVAQNAFHQSPRDALVMRDVLVAIPFRTRPAIAGIQNKPHANTSPSRSDKSPRQRYIISFFVCCPLAALRGHAEYQSDAGHSIRTGCSEQSAPQSGRSGCDLTARYCDTALGNRTRRCRATQYR